VETPEVILLTEDGWWAKGEHDALGWWWERVSPGPPGFIDVRRRYSGLPKVVEIYQPSRVFQAAMDA
jgi:hypothetical protein